MLVRRIGFSLSITARTWPSRARVAQTLSPGRGWAPSIFNSRDPGGAAWENRYSP